MKKLVISLLGIILLLNSCNTNNNIDEQIKPKKIVIGILLPLTGNGALYGKYVQDGISLAISELNTTSYNFIIEDTKTSAKDGRLSISKLMSHLQITKNNPPLTPV